MKIKAISMLIVIILVLTIFSTVFAAENNSVAMSLTSSSKLVEGDTVSVKVNITSINAGNGIDTITAQISYDEDVFEPIAQSDITAGTGWNVSYASSTKMMTIQKSEKVTKPENVLTINFKVKAMINTTSTIVTLQNVVASGGRVEDGGTGDITVSNAALEISKVGSNVVTNNSILKDNTVTKTANLPKTGIGNYAIIAIVVIAIIVIFSFAVYRKTSKKVN